MRLGLLLFTVALYITYSPITVQAQTSEYRIAYLKAKILEKLPDAPYTRKALGTKDERVIRAEAHAIAIVNAADLYEHQWEEFVEQGQWDTFEPKKDLAALVAAIAYRESAFRSVARLDDNSLADVIPKKTRVDAGVMQVRIPSQPAAECGAVTPADAQKLIEDIDFSYRVGVCVLTNRVRAYVQIYRSSAFRRLRPTERSEADLYFYGVIGPRRSTPESKLARNLLVLERYNWGNKDLYLDPTNGGYARRVIREFEFFKLTDEGITTT